MFINIIKSEDLSIGKLPLQKTSRRTILLFSCIVTIAWNKGLSIETWKHWTCIEFFEGHHNRYLTFSKWYMYDVPSTIIGALQEPILQTTLLDILIIFYRLGCWGWETWTQLSAQSHPTSIRHSPICVNYI